MLINTKRFDDTVPGFICKIGDESQTALILKYLRKFQPYTNLLNHINRIHKENNDKLLLICVGNENF